MLGWMPFGSCPAGGGGRRRISFTATPATFLIPLQTAGSPEAWELQGQALIKDVPIGLPSDIVPVLIRR